jgi:hypothetical protein
MSVKPRPTALRGRSAPTSKTAPNLVFHYRCRHCRVLVARDGERWVDLSLGTSCEKTHLPDGHFTNGTRNSTCRYCGAAIVWSENTWVTEAAPPRRTCAFEHTV